MVLIRSLYIILWYASQPHLCILTRLLNNPRIYLKRLGLLIKTSLAIAFTTGTLTALPSCL